MAWKRIKVKNNSNNKEWQGEFETQEELDKWKLKHSEKTWGDPADLTITETDIQAEKDLELAEENERKLSSSKIQAFLDDKNPSVKKVKDAVREIAFYLRLGK